MKNSINYFKGRKTVIAWYEYLDNGNIDYWEKYDGVSHPISRRQYLNRIKKSERQEWEQIGNQKNPQT